MFNRLNKLLRQFLLLAAMCILGVLGVRIYDALSGPPLELWNTFAPHELDPAQLDRSSWADYLKAEDAVFDSVREQVTEKLEPRQRSPGNRYFGGSPLFPGHFSRDWNRSFVLEPAGAPLGAAVLLHGLTDSPYSLRHIAASYRDHGYLAIGLRIPGHGTTPAALTAVDWQDWMAATRLAVREARRRIGPAAPLHIVGYSNGGALALMYALDALEDKTLSRPDQIVLLSPMVGVTRFARFAGLAGVPAIFPAFARAAWLSVLPEFNPFKYNSFPVQAARQSFQLSNALQQRLARLSSEGRLAELAPVLTFQSVVDHTVSTRAIVSALYDRLPANGSELVLFDINRNSKVAPLFRPAADIALDRILPAAPRSYRTTVIADAGPDGDEVVERMTDAGQAAVRIRPFGLVYPRDVYSLSHIALPFPTTDGLYGTNPDPADNFGINLGALEARGERDTLILSLDTLLRMSSNPFYPYMIARIDDAIQAQPKSVASPAAADMRVGAPAPSGEFDAAPDYHSPADEGP